MNHELPKSTQMFQKTLHATGLTCTILNLPNSARTAADAATTLGCDIAHIVKSLIFKTKDTGRPVLVLVSGRNRVDEKQVEAYMGETIVKADAEFVRDVTGFAIGGIPPLGHKNPIDLIFIDQDIIKLDEVWAAAGSPNAVFCIKSKELADITKGTIISVSTLSL